MIPPLIFDPVKTGRRLQASSNFNGSINEWISDQPEQDLKPNPLRHIKCENEILPCVASVGAAATVMGKV